VHYFLFNVPFSAVFHLLTIFWFSCIFGESFVQFSSNYFRVFFPIFLTTFFKFFFLTSFFWRLWHLQAWFLFHSVTWNLIPKAKDTSRPFLVTIFLFSHASSIVLDTWFNQVLLAVEHSSWNTFYPYPLKFLKNERIHSSIIDLYFDPLVKFDINIHCYNFVCSHQKFVWCNFFAVIFFDFQSSNFLQFLFHFFSNFVQLFYQVFFTKFFAFSKLFSLPPFTGGGILFHVFWNNLLSGSKGAARPSSY
jgi:hypothetical protein